MITANGENRGTDYLHQCYVPAASTPSSSDTMLTRMASGENLKSPSVSIFQRKVRIRSRRQQKWSPGQGSYPVDVIREAGYESCRISTIVVNDARSVRGNRAVIG